jgi:hypothetical protein
MSEISNELNPIPKVIDPDAPVAAWILNAEHPLGHLVYRPASQLKKIQGVHYDEYIIKLLKNSVVDLDNPGPSPTFLLSYKTDDGIIPILSLGNFSMLLGKQKAGKGFLAVFLLAILLSEQPTNNTITKNSIEGKNVVIVLDTEQEKSKVGVVGNRLRKLSGGSKNLQVHHTRTNSMKEKLMILEALTKDRTDILCILVDGVVDLVSGANEEDESKIIAEKLMQITGKLNCHIMCVIHENKNNNFSRGMLGLILSQKGEAVFNISKTKEKSIRLVTGLDNREEDWPDFAIEIKKVIEIKDTIAIKYELPYFIEDYITIKATEGEKKSKVPHDYPPETHKRIISKIFENEANIGVKEFKELLKLQLQSLGLSDARDTVTNWSKYYTDIIKLTIASGKGKYIIYTQS